MKNHGSMNACLVVGEKTIPCSYKELFVGEKILFLVQGCISCGILLSGIRARGVSSEHMENMEMFSCSPT